MELSSTHTTAPSLATAIFFCVLCDKPFTKESQYKRHTAYCSKSKGRTRPCSCRACNESKIKCNYCAPCQQCTRKGIRCLYDVPRARRGRTASDSISKISRASNIIITASAVAEAHPFDEKMTTSESSTEKSRTGLESGDILECLNPSQGLQFDTLTDVSLWQYSPRPEGETDGIYCESPLRTSTVMTNIAEGEDFMSLVHNSSIFDFEFQMDTFGHHNGKGLQLSKFSPTLLPARVVNPSSPSEVVPMIFPSLSSDKSLSGHFTKKKIHSSDRKIFVTMILDMIHAYPRMMMRRETFPPFIHANSPGRENPDGENRLPENVTNCMGIAQLFAVYNDDTRLFVWGTIWAELRRLRSKASTFNRCDALSALQVSLLYLVMRAVDDPPREVNHDYEMLEIYQVVLKTRFIDFANDSSWIEEVTQDIQWADWIFIESGRRIGWVWFILGLVFHLHTNVPCFISDHFREMPLPCTKTEWEARTEVKWRVEYENAAVRSKISTLNTFGDLIDAHKSIKNGRKSEGLDIWNAGIDHLGVLLNLAVHLV